MRRGGVKAIAALSGVIAFTAMSIVIPGAMPTQQAHADDTSSAVTVAKRIITDGGTDPTKAATRPATFTVSQTANLASRQTLSLSWTGADPSHNYDLLGIDPSLQGGIEYPVVVAQCWGSDAQGQLDPTHCETNAGLNTYTSVVDNGTNALDTKNSTDTASAGIFGTRLEFHAVDGTTYKMIDNGPASAGTSLPPELQDGAIAHNAAAEWSDASGSRTGVTFEARNFTQYPGTGCSDTQTCTLVMIPITDPACVASLPATDACHSGPATAVGPGNTGPLSTNAYLREGTWWMQTNWRNRLSVPLTFLKQNACSVTDSRRPVQIGGSQVASVAMENSWGPEFCLDPKKFKLQYIQQAEPAARQFLTTSGPDGFENNAALTSLSVTGSPRPLVHAPVLDAGFAISYLIDDSHGAPVTQLRLTPLLLAKLITESYEARSGESALGGNPESLFTDPEFLAVNPGFAPPVGLPIDVGTGIILPSPTQTDTIWALTSYVNADPEARAWLNGQPDAYSGMVVNPAYRDITLPQLATQLLDTTQDPPNLTHPADGAGTFPGADFACIKGGVPAYFNLLSQGVPGLDNALTAMLNLQDPAQDHCDSAVDSTQGQFIAEPRQTVGTRGLIAVTSTAQAAQAALPTAQLQVHDINGQRTWAAPSTAAMTAALAFTVEDKTSGVLSLDFAHLSPNAYPGTMPVYAAIPTSGLSKSDAADYAAFLRFTATDGQTPGNEVGDLLPGYAPLPQVLRDFTLQVANDVATQDGKVPIPPPNLPQQIRNELGISANGQGSGFGSVGGAGLGANGTGGPGGTPGAGSSPGHNGPGGSSGTGSRLTTVAATRGTDSWLAAWGLPLLLGIGLLAGVGVPFVRVAAQPGHPVRLFLAAGGGRVAGLFHRGTA